MPGYTKLFTSILESTVWLEPLPVKVVWITMLAMADRDGLIEASVPGLAKRAGVDREACERALAVFLAPDPDSRTPDFNGRRIEKADGGWRLLNYDLYRYRTCPDHQREKSAERSKRYRDRKARHAQNVTARDVTVTDVTNHDNHPIAEAEAEAEAVRTAPSAAVSAPPALVHVTDEGSTYPVKARSSVRRPSSEVQGDGRFERFWAEYPRRVGKKAARRSWDKLKPSETMTDLIVTAVTHQKSWDAWTRDAGQYIPNPATWLNQGRWDDEPVKAEPHRSTALRPEDLVGSHD